MPIIQGITLKLDPDQVLQGQGADPAVIRARTPRLVEVASQAIEKGLPLLKPQVLFRRLEVEALVHERLVFRDGASLHGKLIAQHMAAARQVIVILCTIGPELEQYASQVMAGSPVDGLALDGVGSAAVEALANFICKRFEERAVEEGLQMTIPLSPGMVGWPVEQGQRQIFSLLNGAQIGVSLSPSLVMIPRKSLSMVLGVGAEVLSGGRTCDYCNLRETCRYQNHYAPAPA